MGDRTGIPIATGIMEAPYSLRQFKAVLHGLGYTLEPEEIDGNRNNQLDLRTQAAIREFQANYGLPITGDANSVTQEKARQLIRNLQHSLNLIVNAHLPISEFYGPLTTRAVQKFQQQQSIPTDGIASRKVRHLLEESVKRQLRYQTYPVVGLA